MIDVFLIVGITIFVGFLALLTFEKTRISQIIILIGFGFLLGPILGIVDVSPNSMVVSLLPFLATLALIVLLFDSGLTIDIFSVAKAIPKSTVFTLLVFIVSVLAITVIMNILGYSILEGVLFGAVLGGTSSAIVNSAVENTKASKETKALLTIESTITDALCIIVAVLAIGLLVSHQIPDAPTIANKVLASFSIAILIGLICSMLWIYIMGLFSLERYAYMLTLALVFGIYSSVEIIGANGGVAVFVFGMILGNAKELSKLLRMRKVVEVNPNISLFQEEITFFVRTFFFVYIGLLITKDYFSLETIGISIGLVGIFIITRKMWQKILFGGLNRTDKNIITIMLPRGLAAAVLATLPAANGIVINGFEQIVFTVIITSNVVSTLGIFIFDKEEEGEKITKEEELQKTIEEADNKTVVDKKKEEVAQIIEEEEKPKKTKTK